MMYVTSLSTDSLLKGGGGSGTQLRTQQFAVRNNLQCTEFGGCKKDDNCGMNVIGT